MSILMSVLIGIALIIPRVYAGEITPMDISPEETGKCSSPSFLSRASDTFACDTDRALGACAKLAGGSVLAAGPSGAIFARIKRASTMGKYGKVFDEYVNLQEKAFSLGREHAQLSEYAYQKNLTWQGALRTYHRSDKFFDGEKFVNYDERFRNIEAWNKAQQEKATQFQKETPEAFKIAQEDFANVTQRISGLQSEISRTEARIQQYLNNNAMRPTIRAGYGLSQLMMDLREADNKRLLDERSQAARGEEYRQTGNVKRGNLKSINQEVTDARAQLEGLRSQARKMYSEFGVASTRGARIAVGVGVAAVTALLPAIPWAINYANSKICDNLATQQDVRKYARIRRENGSCNVILEDDKEFELLTLGDQDRQTLFKTFPILCRAFVKKAELRQQRLVDTHNPPTLRSCTDSEITASVSARNRSYDVKITNSNGSITIESPVGVANSEISNPPMVEFHYHPDTKALIGMSLKPYSAWGHIPLAARNVRNLANTYRQYSGDFKPIAAMEANKVNAVTAPWGDTLITLAEQAVAIQYAAPQITASCEFIRARAANSNGSEDINPSER